MNSFLHVMGLYVFQSFTYMSLVCSLNCFLVGAFRRVGFISVSVGVTRGSIFGFTELNPHASIIHNLRPSPKYKPQAQGSSVKRPKPQTQPQAPQKQTSLNPLVLKPELALG